ARRYIGAVAVRDAKAGAASMGTVVVQLPFAPSSLEVAANPRARAPELLRNLQSEGIGPRVDESERLLLAWIDGGFVTESSTPFLEVGQPLRDAPPAPGGWRRLHLVNGDYLVTRARVGTRELLAGARLVTPLDRLLQWTQLASFAFAVTTVLLLLGAAAAR